MSYLTIGELRSQLGAKPATSTLTPEYVAKMMHAIPALVEKDRSKFILERCAGKRVLEFGASGPMHDGIVKVASFCLGVDREGAVGVIEFDLDAITPTFPGWPPDHSDRPDIIVCGEIIEHLSNPGHFLQRLKWHYTGVPAIITVPNAFTAIGRAYLKRGVENVNADHVAWYSPHTLKTLLGRAGYVITEFYVYNGSDATAEGLIVVAE